MERGLMRDPGQRVSCGSPVEIFADYHTHTVHSHGTGTVADNVSAAARRSLEEVAITDHGPANLFGVGLLEEEELDEIRQEVEEARRSFPGVRVLLGVEANITGLSGRLDVSPRRLEGLDVVLAGLHMPVLPRPLDEGAFLLLGNLLSNWSRALSRKMRVANTKAAVEAVSRNRVDVFVHPGLRMDIDTEELARVCARHGTALEINAGHCHIGVDFVRRAAAWGADFVICSDSHSPERVGDFGRALSLAREARLPVEKILNSRSGGSNRRPDKPRYGFRLPSGR